MDTFRLRAVFVEASQITEDNVPPDVLVAWKKDDGTLTAEAVPFLSKARAVYAVRTSDGLERCELGDWIVKSDGRLHVFNPATFEHMYEKV